MIYAGYVKVALGKPQTGQVKLKITPGTGEAKFSLGEVKKSTRPVTGGVLTLTIVNYALTPCSSSSG